ncbi:MAG: hypothetical protein ACI4IX_02850 [Acutalibacteraceae bacterium]
MTEKVRSRAAVGRIIRALLIIALIIFFIIFLLNPNIFNSGLTFLLLAEFPVLLIYVVFFKPSVKNIKSMKKREIEDIADDIDLGEPDLPKTKIYCGDHAMILNNPRVIVPYADIAWIYFSVQVINGIEFAGKQVNLYCKDGTHYTFPASGAEIQELIDEVIVAFSPDLITGFGAEQRREYYQVKKAYKNAVK